MHYTTLYFTPDGWRGALLGAAILAAVVAVFCDLIEKQRSLLTKKVGDIVVRPQLKPNPKAIPCPLHRCLKVTFDRHKQFKTSRHLRSRESANCCAARFREMQIIGC